MPFNDIKDAFSALAYAGATTAEIIGAMNTTLNQSITPVVQVEVETTPGRRRWIKSESGKFLTQMEGEMHLTFIGGNAIYKYYDMPKEYANGTWYYTYCNGQRIVFNGRKCSYRQEISINSATRIEMDIWDYFIEADQPVIVFEEPPIEEPKLTKQEKNDIINIEENKMIDTEVNLSTLDFNAFLKENTIDYGY